jgi:hypothetical protein
VRRDVYVEERLHGSQNATLGGIFEPDKAIDDHLYGVVHLAFVGA